MYRIVVPLSTAHGSYIYRIVVPRPIAFPVLSALRGGAAKHAPEGCRADAIWGHGAAELGARYDVRGAWRVVCCVLWRGGRRAMRNGCLEVRDARLSVDVLRKAF